MSWTRVFDAARAAFPGCILNDSPTGRIVRFAPDPNRPSKKSGYAICFPDGAGVVGDFRTDYQEFVRGERLNLTRTERLKRMAEALARREMDREAVTANWKRQAEANAALWDSAKEITPKCPAGRYLESRSIYFPDLWHALRWVEKLPYYDGRQLVGVFPAMLGAMRNQAGDLIAVQRFYLDGLGGKARVPDPKKLSRSSGPVVGCSVQLAKPMERNGVMVLGVAEGVETALACRRLFRIGTISAYSAHGMARYEWPDGTQRLFIFGDHDTGLVGQKAAHALAERAQRAGLSARILIPKTKGLDWADVLERDLDKEYL